MQPVSSISDNDALYLSLSAPQEWQRILGQMSEEKLGTVPCRLDLKLYICLENIDVFNLQSFEFEPPLVLTLPYEDHFPRIAFSPSSYEIVIITRKNTLRIDFAEHVVYTEEHQEQDIDPTSPVIIKGDSVLWVSLNVCKSATIKAPYEFNSFS